MASGTQSRSAVDRQERMIRQQVVDRGIDDARLIEALRAVPRERFVPEAGRAQSFADRPIDLGHGQTISQPYMVALMTDRLDLEPHHHVLEVGTGSGYQTAVLAHLAAEVYSVERIKPLLDSAFERLMDLGLRNVHFRLGNGIEGWPGRAAFDRVIVTAAARELPRAMLLSSLKEDGLAVLPAGPADDQRLYVVRRRGDDLQVETICPVRFVPIVESV